MSNTYSKEERLEALKLADEIGPVAAAQRLDINLNTLYNWQSKARKQGITAEHPTPKTEKELREEVSALQKQLKERNEEVEILQAALGFLPNARRDDKASENTVHRTDSWSMACKKDVSGITDF